MTNQSEGWDGVERRSGQDRRSAKDRRTQRRTEFDRRSGLDRRGHPLYGGRRSTDKPSEERD